MKDCCDVEGKEIVVCEWMDGWIGVFDMAGTDVESRLGELSQWKLCLLLQQLRV